LSGSKINGRPHHTPFIQPPGPGETGPGDAADAVGCQCTHGSLGHRTSGRLDQPAECILEHQTPQTKLAGGHEAIEPIVGVGIRSNGVRPSKPPHQFGFGWKFSHPAQVPLNRAIEIYKVRTRRETSIPVAKDSYSQLIPRTTLWPTAKHHQDKANHCQTKNTPHRAPHFEFTIPDGNSKWTNAPRIFS
jgi:hypothetical protein